MPAINNLKGLGNKKTLGKICYSENLGDGLRLIVTQQFSSEDNPCLQFEAGVASEIHKSASGIEYYYDANYIPIVPQFRSKFEDEEIISKKGFVIKKMKELAMNTEKGEIWRETWRVSCGLNQMVSVLKKEEK
jgi:hypothetical protein